MLAFFHFLHYNNKAFRNAEVVEWQTRRTQNPLVVIPCGFKSHLRHQEIRDTFWVSLIFLCRVTTLCLVSEKRSYLNRIL